MVAYSDVIRTKQDLFNIANSFDLEITISEKYYQMLVIDIKKKWYQVIFPFLISKKVEQFKNKIESCLPISINIIYER